MGQTGKTITLITGATRGLGLETAKQLAARGHLVILGGRDLDAAASAARAVGGDAEALRIDLADSATFGPAAESIAARHGRLDVLVNNAGVMHDGAWVGNTAASGTIEALRQTFEVNFFGLVELTRKLLPLLEKSGHGHVVNVSSVMGSLTLHADPGGPLAYTKPFAYDASKAAVNAFTTHLAAAVREQGVRVNSVHPGWVRTELGTGAAPLEVSEGARAIVDLADDRGERSARFVQAGPDLPW